MLIYSWQVFNLFLVNLFGSLACAPRDPSPVTSDQEWPLFTPIFCSKPFYPRSVSPCISTPWKWRWWCWPHAFATISKNTHPPSNQHLFVFERKKKGLKQITNKNIFKHILIFPFFILVWYMIIIRYLSIDSYKIINVQIPNRASRDVPFSLAKNAGFTAWNFCPILVSPVSADIFLIYQGRDNGRHCNRCPWVQHGHWCICQDQSGRWPPKQQLFRKEQQKLCFRCL